MKEQATKEQAVNEQTPATQATQANYGDQHEHQHEQFMDGLYADNYTEHEVMFFAPNWDSDFHCPGHDGRNLVLEGRVVLEMAGKVRVYEAGETYEIPANTAHREVFGDAGGRLAIGRRKPGEPPMRKAGAR